MHEKQEEKEGGGRGEGMPSTLEIFQRHMNVTLTKTK